MTRVDGGLVGTPSANHAVRIVVKDLLLKGVEGLTMSSSKEPISFAELLFYAVS